MSNQTIVAWAADSAALRALLIDAGIVTEQGLSLVWEPAVISHYERESATVDGAPVSGIFCAILYDTARAGQQRMDVIVAALGDALWTGDLPAIANYLGVAPYTRPTGNALIKHERDKRIEQGGYFAGGHWFHSDTVSRDQHAQLASKAKWMQDAGQDSTAPFPNPASPASPLLWKTMGGQWVPMTPALALQIVAAAEVQQASLHMIAAQAMAAGTAPDAVQWPPMFAG